MGKQLSSLQDIFLNEIRKNKTEVTIFLMNGMPLKGRVISFDNFTVLIEIDKKQNLIFKHAISTMVPGKPVSFREEEN